MTLLEIMLVASTLYGAADDPAGRVQYMAAIDAVTRDGRASAEETVALVITAEHENGCHRDSPTPPFGTTYWSAEHGRWPSVREGAEIALDTLRRYRTECGGWEPAFGRYHHGPRGPRAGCWADRLAGREARELRTMLQYPLATSETAWTR